MREVSDINTGECLTISTDIQNSVKYYNVKKLNVKVCIMDFFDAQEIICKSSKDIHILKMVLNAGDKDNEFRKNISKFCKDIGCSRSQLTAIITRGKQAELLRVVDRGVYAITPYLFKAKGCNSETIAMKQSEWLIIENENGGKVL